VAIAVGGDSPFAALCAAMQRPELASDPRFATAGARRAHADALDAEVTAWTQPRDPGEIERRLQADGIAASTVQGSAALCADPQLAYRGHFLTVPHADLGSTTIEGARFQLSRTPTRAPDAAPTYGRDTARVLTELLGYDEARITALVASGVLE
jgi:crotonobetainyl-CoA:carnitine CoA-transferase CaiB-like acyl-CoA transferase